MKRDTKTVALTLGAVVAIAAVAVAASYFTRTSMAPQQTAVVHHYNGNAGRMAAVAPAAGQPPCDDKNIVGTLAGGVAGGVLGNQVGKGSGKTVATVAGAAGGAYLGNEYIPTRGVTCR